MLQKPRPLDREPWRATGAGVVPDLLASLAPSSIERPRGEVVRYATPVTAGEACTAHGTVTIHLGTKTKASLALVVRGTSVPATGAGEEVRDADRLKLMCLAFP